MDIHQLWRCRAGDRARRTQDLAEDTVGVGPISFLIATRPGHYEVITCETRNVRVVLGAGSGAVDQQRPINLIRGSIKLL